MISFKPKNINWDSIQLGTKPDEKLAEELGVTPAAVKHQRWKRKIKPLNPTPRSYSNVDWKTLPLGRKSDRRIAQEYGIPQVVITRHRKQLGIRSFEEVRNDRIKARWESVSFGQYPDWEIADKLHVHIATVIKERRKRKILPYLKMRDANLLDPNPPRMIKRTHTIRTHRPIIRPDIDWDKIPLGTKPDDTLAREFGVSPDALRARRLALGIPSYKKKYIDTDWSKIPLGKVPDWLIAEQLGKGVDAINVARSSRGIPPYAAVCKTTERQTCNAPEGMIDLYWHENNIPHEFQVRLGRFIADWRINGDTIVEYSGWEDHPRYGYIYLERLARKKLYYESLGYKVLIITRKTLRKFKAKSTPAYVRVCLRCHKAVPSYQRGFCKACYKREYLRLKLKAQKGTIPKCPRHPSYQHVSQGS